MAARFRPGLKWSSLNWRLIATIIPLVGCTTGFYYLYRPSLISDAACSATAYTVACGLARGVKGITLASHTRTLAVPYTRSLGSTTPPISRGSMEQDPVKWWAPTARSRRNLADLLAPITLENGIGPVCRGYHDSGRKHVRPWRETYLLITSRSSRVPAFGAPPALFPLGFKYLERGSVAPRPCSMNRT